jgi:murein DD-endopeptidase MepM/ murein hydrolase activator NlpD
VTRLAHLAAVPALLLLLAACSRHAPPAAAPRPAPRAALPPPLEAEDLEYLRARTLGVPVAGLRVRALTSSFDAPRDGGRRLHLALDLLAARGTPVLSADDGRIWKLRSNALGGITIYATDPEERFVYYYAHLDRYHDGVIEGMAVLRGDTLGYVGTTGNAPPTVPHLHFQVARLGPDRRWWAGTPVDPLPFLHDDVPGRRPAAVAGGTASEGGRPGRVRKDSPVGADSTRRGGAQRP